MHLKFDIHLIGRVMHLAFFWLSFFVAFYFPLILKFLNYPVQKKCPTQEKWTGVTRQWHCVSPHRIGVFFRGNQQKWSIVTNWIPHACCFSFCPLRKRNPLPSANNAVVGNWLFPREAASSVNQSRRKARPQHCQASANQQETKPLEPLFCIFCRLLRGNWSSFPLRQWLQKSLPLLRQISETEDNGRRFTAYVACFYLQRYWLLIFLLTCCPFIQRRVSRPRLINMQFKR